MAQTIRDWPEKSQTLPESEESRSLATYRWCVTTHQRVASCAQRAPSANPPHIQTPPAWLRELHKRWSAAGLPLVAVACHPGVIPSSELFRHIQLPWFIQAPLQAALTPCFKVGVYGRRAP
jgi:hypothetical protein